MEVKEKPQSIPFRIFKGVCKTVILLFAAYGALTLIAQTRKPAERVEADMAASLLEKGIVVAPEGVNNGYSPVFGVAGGLPPLEGGPGGGSQVPDSITRRFGGSPSPVPSEPGTKLTMEHSPVVPGPPFGQDYGIVPSFVPENTPPVARSEYPVEVLRFSPEEFQIPEPPVVHEQPIPQDMPATEIQDAPLFDGGGTPENTDAPSKPEDDFIIHNVEIPVFDPDAEKPGPAEIPDPPVFDDNVLGDRPLFPSETHENFNVPNVPENEPGPSLSNAPPFEPESRISKINNSPNANIAAGSGGALFRSLPPIGDEKEPEIGRIAHADDSLVAINRERIDRTENWTNSEMRQATVAGNDFSSDSAIRTAGHEAFDPFNLDPAETPETRSAEIHETPSATAGTARVGGTTGAKNGKNIRKSVYDAAKQMSDAIEKGKVLQGFDGLTQLYDNPGLSDDERAMLLPLLDNLAREVIYSELHFMEKPHQVRAGETVESVAKQYEITPELLMNLNGLKGAARLKPGTELKVVRGPFHAIISLEKKEIQLVLNGYYAGRFRTGIGQVDTIRKDSYAVTGKRKNPPYTGSEGTFLPGTRNNPYGSYELTLAPGLAIHGTNAPETIGTWHDKAPGFNLSDKDIRDLFGILTTDSVVIVK